MKKLVFLSVLVSAILLMSGCSNPASDSGSGSGGSSENIKTQDNLKDVLDKDEDLSGTWELTEAYFLLYNSENGKPDADNFESSNIDEILNHTDKDGHTIGFPKVVTLTKESANAVLRELISNFEETSKKRKKDFDEMDQSLAMAQLFGLRVTKNNKKSDNYVKINKNRTVVTLYDYVEMELAISGSFMGENVDEEAIGKGEMRFVYTKK